MNYQYERVDQVKIRLRASRVDQSSLCQQGNLPCIEKCVISKSLACYSHLMSRDLAGCQQRIPY